MPSEKERWLKLQDGQYQFKDRLQLYADFESILKPVDEQIWRPDESKEDCLTKSV